MLMIRALSFIGDLRFNVRDERVPGCLGKEWGEGGGGGTSRGYMCLSKHFFLVFNVIHWKVIK